MFFRDRLLCLLDEHEQLEKQHEILLAMLAAKGSSGEKRNRDDDEVEQIFPGELNTILSLDAWCKNDALPQLGMISIDMNPAVFPISDTQDQPEVQTNTPMRRPSIQIATRSDILSKKRRETRLKRLLELTESIEEEQKEKALSEQTGLGKRLKVVVLEKLEIFIDTWISVIVLANSLFIGLQMDYDRNTGFGTWQAIDCIFTSIFVFEVCMKCWVHGIQPHFCGPDKYMNLLDVFLIFLDLLQLLLSFWQPRGTDSGGMRIPSASLFRIIRLFRIVRLLRLFRTEKFQDLVSMVQGMITGSTTLFWAIVFFAIIVYVVALICRSSFGYYGVENIEPYFGSVGVSMFTVYRCSFGDCSSASGTPISEHIYSEYGGLYALAYAGVSFVIIVGLFNVISAIFVDATMTSAANSALADANLRLNDERRWATNVTLIIRELLLADTDHGLPLHQLSTVLSKLVKVEFTREHVDTVVLGNPAVHDALEALDIDTYDHRRLSDILDPDHGGTIDVLDLMNGLQRLRGHPRRSDVVTVDLMVRKLQERVDDLHHRICKF